MNRNTYTPYFLELDQKITSLGGLFNAHLHLDRAGTYHETVRLLSDDGVGDGASLSIAGKHALIPMVHASDLYDPSSLRKRTAEYIEQMIAAGTSRADTVVDVTVDRVRCDALDVFIELKQEYRDRIDFRCGAYTPLGFRDDESERWDLFVEGAKKSDFIGLLPERDDHVNYPEHIGFKESCARAIKLTSELGKDIHIHVDQANHQYEGDAEIVVEVVRELGAAAKPGDDPFIWLIHLISPSTYDAGRFETLVEGLAKYNIGVIVCPSAAISMRQYRMFDSPTYNCIARVPELLAAGVRVRLGSDNICDITSPMGTPDLMDELFVLANAMRYYEISVIAKLAAGLDINEEEREAIRIHLKENDETVAAVYEQFRKKT